MGKRFISVMVFFLVTVLLPANNVFSQQDAFLLSPDTPEAGEALRQSPRRSEWLDVPGTDGTTIRTWTVYPEGREKAPVVVLIQGTRGLTDWVRIAADRMAAAGFIALAPDLLSGLGPDGGRFESLKNSDDVVRLMRALKPDDVNEKIDAVRTYALTLPGSNGKSAALGFCSGGDVCFRYASIQPGIAAAVVFYGASPATSSLAAIQAPVLGLYGGDDARVNTTIPPAAAEMKRLNKIYEHEFYEGAGHAFLQRQNEREGANRNATIKAWPRAIRFLKQHLGE